MRFTRILVLICFRLTGQTDAESSAAFVNHLSRQDRHEEAIRILRFERAVFTADSFHFLLGRELHHLRRPDSAEKYFVRVHNKNHLYAGARFASALGRFYLKDVEGAKTILDDTWIVSPEQEELQKLMFAAAALIAREFSDFDSIAAGFAYSHYAVTAEQHSLVNLRSKLVENRKKSPAAAAALSALVPGLGKYYAGRKGAGLAAFLANTILAGIAAENLYRGGPESPQFIGSAALFGVFYAGNIVGSYYSVRQQRRTETGKINNEILATIHLPVHRLFLQ